MTGLPPPDELRRRVEAETGMDFGGERAGRLCDAVSKLPDGPGPWLHRLTAELTVGETYFFRNEHHFRALREHVVPDLRRDARVWSAGCATGEEAYSLAILLDGRPDAEILGTDLNPAFLARAREGLYRPWSFRFSEVHRDGRCFTPEGDGFRLAARLRDRVRFAPLNLVKDNYPAPFDLILFRNVAIYLKPEVTADIVARFRRSLRPGGWLLVSEAEVSLVPTDGFDVRRFDQATLFQKAVTPAAPPPSAVPAWTPLPTFTAPEPVPPPPSIADWLRKGSLAEETGDLAAAERAYRAALYLDRGCLMAHFHLALVQRQQGDRPGAARSLATARRLLDARPDGGPVEHGDGLCAGQLRGMVDGLLAGGDQ